LPRLSLSPLHVTHAHEGEAVKMFQAALSTSAGPPSIRIVYRRKPQSELIGSSDVIREIAEEIECAARSDVKVLITGESGVGKKVVVRMIHERSRRGQSRLVATNCAGAPESVLEAELFGDLLEQAHGGTIFIDEIGEMSLRMQALLLRFLENGETQRAGSDDTQSVVDVRVMAATSSDLLTRIAEKKFSEDLYYRLNMFHIPIPPLRERRDDIAALFAFFVRSYCRHHDVPEPVIAEEVLADLITYDWPGNVRELKHAVGRIVVRSRGTITRADLPKDIFPGRVGNRLFA
jgi:DNA-binding NtrC family response regulator